MPLTLPGRRGAAAAAFLALLAPSSVRGHGYLASPRSRNFVAHEDGVWWPNTAETPRPESEPQSANIGGTDAQCGIISDSRNYDYPKNGQGGDLPPNTQACYQPGSVIDLEVTLTAHHKGHFEFHACPISPGGVADQACFDQHPLEFVADNNNAALAQDPNYPERAYLDPHNWNLSYKFKLPDNLEGDLVLLQWYYITANSCKAPGYDDFAFPDGWGENVVGECTSIPADGRGVPEQFWNCAEVRISTDCDSPPPPPPPPTTDAPPATTTQAVTTQATTTQAVTTTGTNNEPTGTTEAPQSTCSNYNFCGTDYSDSLKCGSCCPNGWDGECPSGEKCFALNGELCPNGGGGGSGGGGGGGGGGSGFEYSAEHGEDSRMIAYVSNWLDCPTAEQVDAYSHLVIAFAVSYQWDATHIQCDEQCTVPTSVPICNGATASTVSDWQAAGKKVILSFGGATQGGSWGSDTPPCWDYCFGREDQVSTALVDLVETYGFDGIDLDFEYCYDNSGGRHTRNCVWDGVSDQYSPSVVTGAPYGQTEYYSDAAAQGFLEDMTIMLRDKLDAVAPGLELTHAPMDSDIVPTSPYYQILKAHNGALDFLMPQFYNGPNNPLLGFAGSTSTYYTNIATDLFPNQPEKVVFGFCLQGCSPSASGSQAVAVLEDIKTFGNGEYECNGGAFFWAHQHDIGGTWSDAVVAEVSKTAGCSNGAVTTLPPPVTSTTVSVTTVPPQTSSTLPATTDPPQTTAPPEPTTSEATSTTTVPPQTSTVPPQTTTEVPPGTTSTDPVTTLSPGTTSTMLPQTTTQSPGDLIISTAPRCGFSEIDARESCKPNCIDYTDCEAGENCFSVSENYCGSIPRRFYGPANGLPAPQQSDVWHRCGTSSVDATTFCGDACTHDSQCTVPGEGCKGVYANYCGSPYSEEGVTTTVRPQTTGPTTTSEATSTTSTTIVETTQLPATTTQPPVPSTPETTTTTTTPETTSTTTTELVELLISTAARCGTSELDAREHCRKTCNHSGECDAGNWCWGVHYNYCGSIPERVYDNPVQSTVWTRCGTSEVAARTFCGDPCDWQNPCTAAGESCNSVHSNYCGSTYGEV